MYEFIKGKIHQLSPAHVVIESYGVGYYLNITLNTYARLQGKDEEVLLYTHFVVREDAHVMFGFLNTNERETFRLLISVSGVGPNTARMMLSSMPAGEVKKAICDENVGLLKSIKGIGAKTAERIIVDLKDKFSSDIDDEMITSVNNTLKIEALSALEVLGFPKKHSDKVLDKLILANPAITVEQLIKQALKVL
ncbi:MAG: Holliday junction branch migration protein RuvA [Bacteroidales bacterium]|nr:Holliday junction branch migration protein RuvA [Bacteroidales bacterium]